MYKLREIERKDLDLINSWRNDPELIEQLGSPFRFINYEVDPKWFDSYMINRGSQVRCAIVDEADDNILGLVSLVFIDQINHSAEFHIMIGNRDNQGKGIGFFAVREMLKHAFNDMNLNRIELTVSENNNRAKHLYEKNGFICEGRKRKARFKDGRFVDMLMNAIIRDDYWVDNPL